MGARTIYRLINQSGTLSKALYMASLYNLGFYSIWWPIFKDEANQKENQEEDVLASLHYLVGTGNWETGMKNADLVSVKEWL